MFCPFCGQITQENDRFCSYCGATLPEPPKKGRRWPAVLALVLIFALGLGVFLFSRPVLNTTADPESPWFSVHNGVLYFDARAYTGDGVLVVPETVSGQTVTALSDSCFYNCDTLIAIHLPSTITYIGSDAFAYCDSLRGIELSESLVNLSSRAFYNCYNLESVCIPASLRNVGNDIFTGCDNLFCLFYSGSLDSWKALNFYSIPTGTVLSCTDGLFSLN